MPLLELNQKTSRFRSDEILALQRAGGQGSLVLNGFTQKWAVVIEDWG